MATNRRQLSVIALVLCGLLAGCESKAEKRADVPAGDMPGETADREVATPVENECAVLGQDECEASVACEPYLAWPLEVACASPEPTETPVYLGCRLVDEVMCNAAFTWARPDAQPDDWHLFPDSCVPPGWQSREVHGLVCNEYMCQGLPEVDCDSQEHCTPIYGSPLDEDCEHLEPGPVFAGCWTGEGIADGEVVAYTCMTVVTWGHPPGRADEWYSFGSSCLPDGWVAAEQSPCESPPCQPELCNGMDDDCDGEVDEGCGECFDAVCADVLCTENCEDPACAIDCCDGSCFLCPAGGVCSQGECCMPDCTAKECGADGCGGWCGHCPDWYACDDGECVVDNPCGVQYEGQMGCNCGCEECTCEKDPYCCDHPWDAKCIYTCTTFCGGCETCRGECFDQECGSDGCGGWCGNCPNDAPYCIEGHCQAECTPDCAGKVCGPDGCGGSCGTCPELEVIPDYSTMVQGCGPDGQCHCSRCLYEWSDDPESCEGDCQMMICMPDCTGRECGSDGCGGSCGQCGWGATCDMGQCVCAFP